MTESISEKTKNAKPAGRRLAFVCMLIGILLLIFDFLMILPVNIPRLAGYQAFFITTGSMDPVIPTGSIAYFKTVDPASLQVGDMIAYLNTDGIIVVHRVNRIVPEEQYLQAKGDNNKILDKDRITFDRVRGIYYGFIPGIGKLMYFMHSAVGRIIMIFSAAAGAFLILLSVILRLRRKKETSKGDSMLQVGIKGTGETIVTAENTAKAFCSGKLDVFATPAMIALVEETCWKLVQPELEEGSGTVGTKVDVSHLAPSPIGHTVRCEAVLKEVDGRRLIFEAVCTDGDKVVGKGTHERFIINNEKFMAKAGGGQ